MTIGKYELARATAPNPCGTRCVATAGIEVTVAFKQIPGLSARLADVRRV